MRNLWLINETLSIEHEMRDKSKKWDNVIFSRLMIFLIPLFFYAINLDAAPKTYPCYKIDDGGIYFTCQKCRISQWQDKQNCDWTGYYYCRNCGEKAQ